MATPPRVVGTGLDVPKTAPSPGPSTARARAPAFRVHGESNIPELITAWESTIKEATVELGNELLMEAFMEVYQTDGFGTWPRKSPEQIENLAQEGNFGASKLMAGKTLALKRGVRTFDPERQGETLGASFAGGVGWDDETHPDPGLLGGSRQSPRPTLAQIAAAHEFGVKKGGQVKGAGIKWWGGALTGDGSPIHVPERPWASLAADRNGFEIVTAMRAFASRAIGAFNSIETRGF